MKAYPTLPEDWRELATGAGGSSDLEPWFRGHAFLVKCHGVGALSSASIHEWVLAACGVSNRLAYESDIRGRFVRAFGNDYAQILRVPINEWLGNGGRRRCSNAVEDVRSFRRITAEWETLVVAMRNGAQPCMPELRRTGCGDWLVVWNRQNIEIEVKAKGEISPSREELPALVAGHLLLSSFARLRQWSIRTYAGGDAEAEARLGRPTVMNKVVVAMPRILHWLLPRLDEAGWASSDEGVVGKDFKCTLYEVTTRHWQLCVEVVSERSVAEVWMEGQRNEGEPMYWPCIVQAEFERGRVSSQEIEQVLARLIAAIGDWRPKKRSSLLVLHWPIPWWWESSVAADKQLIPGLVDALAAQLSTTSDAPVALWPRCPHFTLPALGWVLNDAAKDLLGRNVVQE